MGSLVEVLAGPVALSFETHCKSSSSGSPSGRSLGRCTYHASGIPQLALNIEDSYLATDATEYQVVHRNLSIVLTITRLQDREDAKKRVRSAPKRSWSTASLEGHHQTAETHAGGSCLEVL